MGVRGQTLEWFKSYLSNRSQAVFINGVLSEHEQIKCGVPQGSILGPLLFLIYINDLSSIIGIATTRMYANDTNLTFTACNIPELQEQMSVDIQCLKNWLIANKLTLNVIKTEFMLVGSRQRIATMTENMNTFLNGISLNRVNCSKCLGVEIDEFLTWDTHIASVSKKVSSGISIMRKVKPFIPISSLLNIYQSIVEPYFDYCSIVWNGIGDNLADKLKKLQNRAARVISGADYLTPANEILNKRGWSNLKERRNKQKALMMFKIFNGMTPRYLKGIFSARPGASVYNLRTSLDDIAIPRARTDYYRKSFAFTGAKIWNALPNNMKSELSFETFRNKLKSLDLSIDI